MQVQLLPSQTKYSQTPKIPFYQNFWYNDTKIPPLMQKRNVIPPLMQKNSIAEPFRNTKTALSPNFSSKQKVVENVL